MHRHSTRLLKSAFVHMRLSFAPGFSDGMDWTSSIVHLALNSHNHGFKDMLVTVESMPERAGQGIEAFQSGIESFLSEPCTALEI
jgi:hypothetical protein